MITLEKIIDLDDKINCAVKVIKGLREENQLLKNKISSYHTKITKLEELVSTFKDDQDEIEAGIKNAVNTLNQMLLQNSEQSEITRIPTPLKQKIENQVISINDINSFKKEDKEVLDADQLPSFAPNPTIDSPDSTISSAVIFSEDDIEKTFEDDIFIGNEDNLFNDNSSDNELDIF